MKKTGLRIFITVLIVYLFYAAPGYLTSNTYRYIALTRSIVEDHTFNIDKYRGKTRDWGRVNGHHYVGAAPGLSMAAVPIYALVKPLISVMNLQDKEPLEYGLLHLILLFFFGILPGALTAYLVYRISGLFALEKPKRVITAFAFSFGTIMFFYSTRFMSHAFSTFLAFLSFYLLITSKTKANRPLLCFIAGLSIGYAVLTDYIMIVCLILLILYLMIDIKKVSLKNMFMFLAGSALMGIPYLYYHYQCFGNPFLPAAYYSETIGPKSLGFPDPVIMAKLLFSPYRGLFLYMPVMFCVFYALVMYLRDQKKVYAKEVFFIFSFSLSVICIMSSFSVWDGGGDFGPRYFVCLLPFLMLVFPYVFRHAASGIIMSIVSASVFINWCGVQYGDTDRVYVNAGLFLVNGMNSGLTEWFYLIVNLYVRKFGVIQRFSPLVPFMAMLLFIIMIWKKELKQGLKIL